MPLFTLPVGLEAFTGRVIFRFQAGKMGNLMWVPLSRGGIEVEDRWWYQLITGTVAREVSVDGTLSGPDSIARI